MANRYQDLLSALPKGKDALGNASGEVLPFLDRPHQFQLGPGLTPGDIFNVSFNDVASGQVVADADGIANAYSIPGLPPGEYTIKFVHIVSGATRQFFVTIKNVATWFAAYADILNQLDDEIDEMDAARSLATVTPTYIEAVYGRALRQPRPSLFRHEDYRNTLRQLRPAYRHFGAHPYGLKQAVEAFTSVSPLTVPDHWRPHWILGGQVAPNGDFQERSREAMALHGAPGAVATSPDPELPNLNRQSRYWVHPGVGVGLVSSGFRAPPRPQLLTVTLPNASQAVNLTGLDESGLLIAETVPDPSVTSVAGTYTSQLLFSSVLTAQRIGPGGGNAQIGLGEDRFIRLTRLGDHNRPGSAPTLNYEQLDALGNPLLFWAGGDVFVVPVREPLEGYGLSLTVISGGLVTLGNTNVVFTGTMPGQTITVINAQNVKNNGTFVIREVGVDFLKLVNAEAIDETADGTHPPFHWIVNASAVPFVGTATLTDVDRHATAIGRQETTTTYNLDPGAYGDARERFDRLFLELDDRGVVQIGPLGATTTPAAAVSAINSAFNADVRYGAGYATIASVLTGTEGDNKSVVMLRAPNGLSASSRSMIKIHPGPADGSELIFGLPRSSTHLLSTLAGYSLNCADTSRMPAVLSGDLAPFRRRFKVRIRGLRHLSSGYTLLNANASGTEAQITMGAYTFTAADVGGYVFLTDSFQAQNNGLHRIVAVGSGLARVRHAGAATGGSFDDNLGVGSSGTAVVWGKGEIHTVINNNVAGHTLTLDSSEPTPFAWQVGSIVELIEEAPFKVKGTVGIGEADIAIDVRYRPYHDFGDSIANVAGSTWRLTSARADFTAISPGQLIIVEGCINLENDNPPNGFSITNVGTNFVDYTNGSAIAEASNFEWHIDIPGTLTTDSVSVLGARMPDGWQILSAGTTATTTNNDPTATDLVPGMLVPSRLVLHASSPGTIQFQRVLPEALSWRGLPLLATFWIQEHTANGSTFAVDVSFDGTHFFNAATSTSIPASVLTSTDTSSQYIGPLDPFTLEGTFFVPYDAATVIIRLTRTPSGAGAGTISFEKMTLRSATGTGLAVGDNTVPRSQKRAKFGELLYVWSAENLTDEERGYLGLPLDSSSVPTKPGHIDYVTNAHGYWDRVDVTEIDDSGLTPIRNNVRGVFDSIDWAGLEIAGGLTNMETVIGTPSRLSYARPTLVTHVTSEALVMIDGGDGPGYARATLSQASNHQGTFPQAPNTSGGTGARLSEIRTTDTNFVNADGLMTIIPAGSPIPLPDDLDVNGVQPWDFTTASQIRIHPPYFNAASSYVLDFDILMRITTQPFALASGANVPADYTWLIDFSRYLRHNINEPLVTRVEQAQFLANFTAKLSERADTTQVATLEVDDGVSLQTVLFSDWSFVDSKTIRINSAVFNQNALYTITYTAKIPDVKAKAILNLEWRSGVSSMAITSNPWQTVVVDEVVTPFFDPLGSPDITQNQVQPWHQLRVTLNGVEDVRDVRIYSLGVKGAHLYGVNAHAPGILTPGP